MPIEYFVYAGINIKDKLIINYNTNIYNVYMLCRLYSIELNLIYIIFGNLFLNIIVNTFYIIINYFLYVKLQIV